MHQAATTNPLIIMAINMTVVFAVLVVLSFMIRLIHMVDPTKKKPAAKPAAAPAPKPAAAPAAAPVAVQQDDTDEVAVIAAAVAMVESQVRIVAIRPIESTVWKNSARATALANTVY